MADSLTPEEVAILIQARQIQREKNLNRDFDVTSVCQRAGVSRKTGYQWVKKHIPDTAGQKELEQELTKLRAEYEKIKKEYDRVDFENEGRKLAWEIHHVDEWLASKKNTSKRRTKKKQ